MFHTVSVYNCPENIPRMKIHQTSSIHWLPMHHLKRSTDSYCGWELIADCQIKYKTEKNLKKRWVNIPREVIVLNIRHQAIELQILWSKVELEGELTNPQLQLETLIPFSQQLIKQNISKGLEELNDIGNNRS